MLNKKTINNFGLIIIMIFSFAKLNALVSAFALLKKGDKTVLLIGEAHARAMHAPGVDKNIWSLLTKKEVKRFGQWLSCIDKPTAVIIENKKDNLAKPKKNSHEFMDLIAFLKYSAVYNSNKELIYKAADYRIGETFKIIFELLPTLIQADDTLLLPPQRSPERADEIIMLDQGSVQMFKRAILQQYNGSKKIDMNILLNGFRDAIKLIKDKAEVIVDDKSKKLIAEEIAKLELELDHVSQLIRALSSNDYIELFIKYVFGVPREKQQEKKSYWPTVLGAYLADIGFLAEVCESLQEFNQVVVASGKMHTLNLLRYLKGLGFEVIMQEGSFEDTYDENYKMVKLDDKALAAELNSKNFIAVSAKLEKLFSETFVSSPLVFAVDEKKDDSKKEIEKICANGCNKMGDKCCGRCKKVFYCSKECQQAHWKTHKKDCNSK